MFHMVEHLPDPRKTLQELAGLISPLGGLVIEVPSSSDALLTLYACEALYHFTYWSQHLYLFNLSTLATLARHAELKIDAIRNFQRYPL